MPGACGKFQDVLAEEIMQPQGGRLDFEPGEQSAGCLAIWFPARQPNARSVQECVLDPQIFKWVCVKI